jgi:hypothetical protein
VEILFPKTIHTRDTSKPPSKQNIPTSSPRFSTLYFLPPHQSSFIHLLHPNNHARGPLVILCPFPPHSPLPLSPPPHRHLRRCRFSHPVGGWRRRRGVPGRPDRHHQAPAARGRGALAYIARPYLLCSPRRARPPSLPPPARPPIHASAGARLPCLFRRARISPSPSGLELRARIEKADELVAAELKARAGRAGPTPPTPGSPPP